MGGNKLRRQTLQIELQTTRKNRNRHLLRIRCGQNKFDVFGRFLQSLKHGVKCRGSQLVNFVDHVDLKAGIRRNIFGSFQKRNHVVNTAGRSRVHFDVIYETIFINRATSLAHSARLCCDAAFPVRPDTV